MLRGFAAKSEFRFILPLFRLSSFLSFSQEVEHQQGRAADQ